MLLACLIHHIPNSVNYIMKEDKFCVFILEILDFIQISENLLHTNICFMAFCCGLVFNLINTKVDSNRCIDQ